jgi:uncharacterized membrane protein
MLKASMKALSIVMALRSNPFILSVGASVFVGILAASFLGLWLAISFAREGFWALVWYFESWMVPAGFVLFPFFFFIMKKTSMRSVALAALACQIVGVGLMIISRGQMRPCTAGVMAALFSTGYWQMHHLALSQITSHEGRAVELSFLAGLTGVASLTGAAIAGVMSGFSAEYALYIAFILQAAATLGLALTLPKAGVRTSTAADIETERFWVGLRAYPRQNLGMAVDALHELVTALFLSTWLVTAGFPVIFFGVFRAIGSIAAVFVMPFCAAIVHRGRGQEFRWAGLAGIGGWLVVLIIPSAFVILAANFLWSMAVVFLNTGLESRWYSRRSPDQILTRELVLTCVRVPGIIVFAWIATRHPSFYPLAGIATSLIVLPYGVYLLGSQRESSISAHH